MILNRKQTFNISKLQDKYEEVFDTPGAAESFNELSQFIEMQQLYNAAMKQVATKLEILEEEFQIQHKHNPIHHVECRLKNPRSILEKLMAKGYPVNMDSARKYIRDIAGVRVICNYIEDAYTIEKLLCNQKDLTLESRKDYIAQPKSNGYRSLHLILSVPIYLSDRVENVMVEIQIRTIAMDYWACLEHNLRYKNDDSSNVTEYKHQLKECADMLSEIELKMLNIHLNIT